MRSSGLHIADILVLSTYVCFLLGVGLYFARQKVSASEFVRGRKTGFGWLPLGLSLMAATNSGIDYLQTPSIVYAYGIFYMVAVLTWVPTYFWATRVTVPLFRQLDAISIYEYLERRFNVWVRTAAAVIFVLWRIGWMGAAIYVPCLAVKAATGSNINVMWMVIALGSLVTFYTMLGGMRAVVWTDSLQFIVMFGGVVVILVVVFSHIPGGMSEVWETAKEAGRLELSATIPGFSEAPFAQQVYLYLTQELTLIGVFCYIMVAQLSAFTCDQVSLQRLQVADSMKAAGDALKVTAVTAAAWTLLLGFIGLLLLTFYRNLGLPPGMPNDNIVPHFIATNFPVGWTGLVFGGIFAASLSSVDSAINSTTAIIVADFYNRLFKNTSSEAATLASGDGQVRVFRFVSLCLGVGLTIVGTQIERLGELYTAANKVIGAFFGPLLGIFLLGMFVRRATALGASTGAIAGLLTSCFLSFFSELTLLQSVCGSLFGVEFVEFFKHVSWQWSSPLGVLVTLTIGILMRRSAASEEGNAPLTYARVMAIARAEARTNSQRGSI